MTVLATLVYITKDDQTLMIHRVSKDGDLHKGKFNGLGGKFEPGESPLECAIREVKEESNLDISDIKLKGHILFPKFDKKGRDWLVFIYRADEFTGELKRENPEGILDWCPTKDLLNLNLWDGDKIFIPHVFSNSTFEGKFFYKDGNLDHYQFNLFEN
jgi:8-oxo-dGTP diphosphatase